MVDDSAEFRSAARALLEAEGYAVVAETARADETMRAVGETAPDLVLLDVRLVGQDGISLAGDLALLSRPPQVVLVSSRPASAYGERLRQAPVRGFLAKEELSGAALRRLVGDVAADENG